MKILSGGFFLCLLVAAIYNLIHGDLTMAMIDAFCSGANIPNLISKDK